MHGRPDVRPESSGLERFLGVDGTGTRQARPAREAVSNWGDLAHQPFTPAWYADHPNAWHATHPHADVFVAATAVGLAGWLAVPVTAISGGAVASGGSVEYAETGTEAAPSETSSSGDPAAANELDDVQWMPLGVYALGPWEEAKARLVLQMAVNREGVLRGSQFDTTTQEVENVAGFVDKQSLRAAWRLGDNRPETFETTLGELTKSEGSLVLRFPEGRRENWKSIQIAR
jgi:hypothetical protein